MSWLTDFFRALGRIAGAAAGMAPDAEQRPKPVPITTREELGWDDDPTKPEPPKGAA